MNAFVRNCSEEQADQNEEIVRAFCIKAMPVLLPPPFLRLSLCKVPAMKNSYSTGKMCSRYSSMGPLHSNRPATPPSHFVSSGNGSSFAHVKVQLDSIVSFHGFRPSLPRHIEPFCITEKCERECK